MDSNLNLLSSVASDKPITGKLVSGKKNQKISRFVSVLSGPFVAFSRIE
jgi:hypothetical protein